MADDFNQTYASLERVIKNVLDRCGLLRVQHEIGVVAEEQIYSDRVLVQSLIDDGPPQYITSVVAYGNYTIGDKVLIQYLNRDINNKVVIGVLSKAADYTQSIDYNNLPETPIRLYREDIPYSYNPCCGGKKDKQKGGKCPELPRVVKIVYGEGDPLEWTEIYNRDSRGFIISITTLLPPNNSITITNYVVRDKNNFLMEYYGPSPTGEVIVH